MKPVSDEDVAAVFSGERPDALALVYERFGPLVYSIALRALAMAGLAAGLIIGIGGAVGVAQLSQARPPAWWPRSS
jgi:hypothetical protein